MKKLALLLACVAGSAMAQSQPPRCIELRSEVARYYRCLNEDLRRLVPSEASRASPALPYSATSPSHQVGGFSIAATRQMLGRNFGVSNRPDRPPSAYTAPSPLFAGR